MIVLSVSKPGQLLADTAKICPWGVWLSTRSRSATRRVSVHKRSLMALKTAAFQREIIFFLKSARSFLHLEAAASLNV